MKNTINIIEKYLHLELALSEDQIKYELSRFERNPDIGNELASALASGHVPRLVCVKVMVNGKMFTAHRILKRYKADSIYAAYSLLTQIREHPEMEKYIKRGLIVK